MWIKESILGWCIAVIGSFLLLTALFSRFSVSAILAEYHSINLAWLTAALITVAGPVALANALRWRTLVVAMGLPVSVPAALRLTYSCYPLNVFLPGKSGDLLKALALPTGGTMRVAGSVVAERAVDLLVIACLATIGGIIARLWLVVALALALALLVCGLIGLSRCGDAAVGAGSQPGRWQQVLGPLRELAGAPQLALAVFVWSSVGWLLNSAVFVMLVKALGIPVTPVLAFVAQPVAVFVGLVPVSVSGLGTREWALIHLLGDSVLPQTLVSVSLLYTVCTAWFLGLLGLPQAYWVLAGIRRRHGS